MYRIRKYIVKQGDPLFGYLDESARLANNLYNASLFRIRQVLTGVKKDKPTPTEQSVFDEIDEWLPAMNAIRHRTSEKAGSKLKLFERPDTGKSLISYGFLECLLKVSKNQDYLKLSIQTSQGIVKRACGDVRNFFAAMREWKINPDKFTGRPRLTRYKAKGGACSYELTNQDCRIRDGKLLFPKCKASLETGLLPDGCRLKKVDVVPHHGVYSVILTLDDGKNVPPLKSEKPVRIAGIDFGIDNIAAIANNVGQPGLLFKGGHVKARNQLFNKRRAKAISGMTRGCLVEDDKVTSRKLERMSLKRQGFMETEFHTMARRIIGKLEEWDIDTLVLGWNDDWKRESNIGAVNNQNFIGIPHAKLAGYLENLAAEKGIRTMRQEESYTSRASFLNMDPIPVYGSENGAKPEFSGRRECRGMYKLKGSPVRVNADLNGAGNILRKAFPDAFARCQEFRFLKDIESIPSGAIRKDSGRVDRPSGLA